MRINLKKTPRFAQTYGVSLNQLTGGLNIRDQGYLVAQDESPYMVNLHWREGLLQTRPSQKQVTSLYNESFFTDAEAYAATDFQFHGYTFFHFGTGFQCMRLPVDEETEPLVVPYYGCLPGMDFDPAQGRVEESKGTFFRYQNHLFYKNEGGFYEIIYDENYSGDRTLLNAAYRIFPGTTATSAVKLSLYAQGQNGWAKVTSDDQLTLEALQVADAPIVLYHDASGTAIYAEMTGQSWFEFRAVEVSFANGVMTADVQPTLWKLEFYEHATTQYSGPGIRLKRRIDSRDPADANPDYRTGFFGRGYDGGTDFPRIRPESDADNNDRAYWVFNYSSSGSTLVSVLDNGKFGLQYSSTPVTWTCGPFYYRNLAEIAEEDDPPVIVINASPVNGSGTMYQPENRLCSKKTVWYNAVTGTTVYQLPVKPVDAVTNVTVGGVTKYAGTDYTVDLTNGIVTFTTAPDPGNPAVNNTVHITYKKANPDALNAVLGCPYATVASGGNALQFILLGGNAVQPDAIFWNANDELVVSPYYFPMSCYNLIGTRGDAVTGFGNQYNDTLVFTSDSIGKLTYSIEDVDGRNTPSFGYERVNDKVGCDLPWTIQTIENNVCFCNTYTGAHMVWSSSSAYENNVLRLTEKVNPDGHNVGVDIRGLLWDIANSTAPVVSYDDDERYWVCANGKVYVWDYEISTYADPSWFYWTGISPVCLFKDAYHDVYLLASDGKILKFGHDPDDNGVAIPIIFRTPTMHFGAYERLKNVEDLILTFRDDWDSYVLPIYQTDYERREDKTACVVYAPTYSGTSAYTTRLNKVIVFKRRPMCKHIRQFALELRSNAVGKGFALASVDLFYRYTGIERGTINTPLVT